MRRAAGATPDANERAVDFDQKDRHKRMRADAKMCRAAGDALMSGTLNTGTTSLTDRRGGTGPSRRAGSPAPR
jgi:hypothetical protein